MSATTTQLLSSGQFCKLRYDTVPVKSASANFFSIPKTQKCQIFSCDTLVANERIICSTSFDGKGNAETRNSLTQMLSTAAYT